MKKQIISAAVAVFACTAFMASAQQPADSTACKATKECCSSKKISKEKAGVLRAGAKAQPRLNLMSGIELNAEQKSKIEAAREKRDSKLKKATAERTKKEQSIEESYQKELKKIMTPEQYKRYEDNASKIRRQREKIMNKADQGRVASREETAKRKTKINGVRTLTDSTASVGEMKPGPKPERVYKRN